MNLRTSKYRGFSLIELLVVLAILALLVGLVGPRLMNQLGGAKADTANLQIADLSAALDLFYIDTGRYPTSEEGLDVLLTAPDAAVNWNGPYLKKKKVPQDPWGEAYLYKAPGKEAEYELLSLGADKTAGGDGDNADIKSWE